MSELLLLFTDNKMIELVMLVICVDTVLGILRAIKYHRFNSSVGIDGAIRKVAMLVSVCALMAADCLVHVNLLALVPEEYLQMFGIRKVGLCELFGLLFIAYECISILKNMLLCDLPVPKKLRGWLEDFLENMTAELPQGMADGGVRHG